MHISPDDPRLLQCGFAKLQGDDLEFYIRKYEIVLGRRSQSRALDVELGENSSISRQHAVIRYNFDSKAWELVVQGKNGVTVNGSLFTPQSLPAALHSQDLLQIGDRSFYFLLPRAAPRKAGRRPLSTAGQQAPGAAPLPPAAAGAAAAAAAHAQPPPAAAAAAPGLLVSNHTSASAWGTQVQQQQQILPQQTQQAQQQQQQQQGAGSYSLPGHQLGQQQGNGYPLSYQQQQQAAALSARAGAAYQPQGGGAGAAAGQGQGGYPHSNGGMYG